MYKVWWQNKDNNFGDLLTPYILDFYNIKYSNVDVKQNNLLVVGSIIRHANNDTTVLGSGIIKSKEKLNPFADYRFVRGKFTREKLLAKGANCPALYGDAGLLIDKIFPPLSKKYKLGIIPHFVDYQEVKQKFPNEFVINLKDDVKQVAQQISSCEKIISSSLHGLVVAQAYNIPFAWVQFSNKLKGDGIKFYDFFDSINLDPLLSDPNDPKYVSGKYDTTNIDEILRSLND